MGLEIFIESELGVDVVPEVFLRDKVRVHCQLLLNDKIYIRLY